uniref:Uncharacterized protein n=1 Tax=Anguilla anguilla TaxID=7936 RepID=A0A0E9VYH9_ANGAN
MNHAPTYYTQSGKPSHRNRNTALR